MLLSLYQTRLSQLISSHHPAEQSGGHRFPEEPGVGSGEPWQLCPWATLPARCNMPKCPKTANPVFMGINKFLCKRWEKKKRKEDSHGNEETQKGNKVTLLDRTCVGRVTQPDQGPSPNPATKDYVAPNKRHTKD